MTSGAGGGPRPLQPRPASDFDRALALLQSVDVRREVQLSETPAPKRLAPHAVSIGADVVDSAPGGEEAAETTGRFVLLHDPDGQESWEGIYRVITYVKSFTEVEMADDPLLGRVGWSWLTDALASHDAAFHAPAGTVTRVLNESFGVLDEEKPTGQVEIRASWTPSDAAVDRHLLAWVELLCMAAGLPPTPPGVVPIPRPRRP